MAKVILTDNFNRDNVADMLYKDNFTDSDAERIAEEYNTEHKGSDWIWFARNVPDEYKLWRGVAELV